MRLKSFKFLIIALTFFVGFGNTQAQEVAMDEMLDMDLSELMNVPIVIASKKSEGSFTAPLSTTVLSREEIEKSGVTSIEEAFKLVPGMIVREKTNGNFDVHIRGNDNIPPQNMSFYSENTSTLIMVDGRKVFNYINGGVFWETLPISLNDIERIEIIRGPSTAMYGPNAMSGVINIVTVNPKDEQITANGSAQYGSQNTGLYNFAIGSSSLDDKLKLRVGANYESRDRSSTNYYSWFKGEYVPRDGIVDYSGVPVRDFAAKYPNPDLAKERMGVVASVGYDFTKDIQVDVQGGYQESKVQTIFMETQSTPISNRLNESMFVNAMAKLYGLELNLSNSQGDQNIDEGNVPAQFTYNVMDVTAEYNFELGNLALRPGLSMQNAIYSDLDYAGAYGAGYVNASQNLLTTAGYVRGDYKATDKLRLIGAVRADKYNMPNVVFVSYQATATYSINSSNFIRASYGRANKGPVIIDSYANYHTDLLGRSIRYQGNPELDLTYNNTAEFGYRWMAMNNLSVDAELFYSTTAGFTVFEPISVDATNGVVATYQNLDLKSNILGGALSVNYILSKDYQFKLWAGYSDAQLTNYKERITPLIPAGTNPAAPNGALPTYQISDIVNPQTPELYGGASIVAQPIDRLTATIDCYYLGKHEYVHDFDVYAKMYSSMPPAYFTAATGYSQFKGSGRVVVDDQFTMNLKVSYDIFKRNQIFVNCRNLFNTDTPQFGFGDSIGSVFLLGVKIDL